MHMRRSRRWGSVSGGSTLGPRIYTFQGDGDFTLSGRLDSTVCNPEHVYLLEASNVGILTHQARSMSDLQDGDDQDSRKLGPVVIGHGNKTVVRHTLTSISVHFWQS